FFIISYLLFFSLTKNTEEILSVFNQNLFTCGFQTNQRFLPIFPFADLAILLGISRDWIEGRLLVVFLLFVFSLLYTFVPLVLVGIGNLLLHEAPTKAFVHFQHVQEETFSISLQHQSDHVLIEILQRKAPHHWFHKNLPN